MKEVFEFEGRNLEIQDNSSQSLILRENIKELIKDFFNSNSLVKSLSYLTIFLEDEIRIKVGDFSREIRGRIDLDKTAAGKPTIILSLSWLSDLKDSELRANTPNVRECLKTVNSILTHETTHLYQEQKGNLLSIIKNLRKQAVKYSNKSKFSSTYQDIQYFLMLFFHALVLEGSAMYAEKYLENKIEFTHIFSKVSYHRAKKAVARVSGLWNNLLNDLGNNREPRVSLESVVGNCMTAAYSIGKHMCFLILYHRKDLSINDVLSMNPIKFLKVYEKIEIKNEKRKPLISSGSGKGHLDYRVMLKQLQSEIK